ncbi:MAG TPA: thiolase family protein [Hyphomicrobiaceae bacterium]|nr:thiolase family protein [Hyphomicrobiaceae bacterium]
MKDISHAQSMTYEDVWLLGGARTPFADYNGTLRDVSATDLGIKVGREALRATSTAPEAIDAVIAASVAQTSFDAFFLPRHIGIYSGVPIEVPALLVQRLCTSGFEAILQAADQLTLGKAETVLCVGTESMSRNPIAAYSHRGGFKMGQVEFKDFLWEATLDTAPRSRMGDTAEELAKRYQITREDTDDMAKASFDRALQARDGGYFDGEIVPVVTESFEREGYQPRGIRLPRKVEKLAGDEHPRPTSREALAALKPAFNGVQTGGNSSAIVDGAAGVVVGRKGANGAKPLARIVAGAAVGVPPEIMGIGPAPAIRAVLDKAGLKLDRIDRFEINEAFGAQYVAVERELGLDRARVNVNGGAIAIGHPLGATGVRCTHTLARELKRSRKRYGIATACAGGGQGVAILIENPDAGQA